MTIDLEVSDDDLLEISERGLLALNLQEMKAIQSHYRDPAVRSRKNRTGTTIGQTNRRRTRVPCPDMVRALFAQDIRCEDQTRGQNNA